MTTIMESSTLESVNDETSHIYVPNIHKTIIKLGIHFILKQVIEAVNTDKEHKKLFYYRMDEKYLEYQLVKRIFNVLPSIIKYGKVAFRQFIKEQDYEVWKSPSTAKLSFQNFRNFLKRYDLKHLEKEFLADVNIKLSLLP